MFKSIWASRVTAVELEGVTASPGSEPPSNSTPNITNLTNHMPEANKPGLPVAPPKMLALPPQPPPPPPPPPLGAGESVSGGAPNSSKQGLERSKQLQAWSRCLERSSSSSRPSSSSSRPCLERPSLKLELEGLELELERSKRGPELERADTDSPAPTPRRSSTSSSGLEANKADAMCDIIDHSVNLLALNATAHLLAADYYYSRYCLLASLSIAVSAIVAVWGRILPSETVGTGTRAMIARLPHSHECLCSHRPAPAPAKPAPHAVAVSAICNASNTLLLGLMALMRFETKSMLHEQVRVIGLVRA